MVSSGICVFAGRYRLLIDRHEINQAIYFGLAIEGQNTLLPQSPLYEPTYRSAWARFDPAEANRLLDLIGLAKRGSDGIRLLPDGRPIEIIVENSGESTEQSDVLELIRDSWRRIGIKLFAKTVAVDPVPTTVFSGEALMSVDKGDREWLGNGRHVALGIRADDAAATRMAEMGPVLRDERRSGRSRRIYPPPSD